MSWNTITRHPQPFNQSWWGQMLPTFLHSQDHACMNLPIPWDVASMESPNCTPKKQQPGDGLNWYAKRVEIYMYIVRGGASAWRFVNCIFIKSLVTLSKNDSNFSPKNNNLILFPQKNDFIYAQNIQKI